METRAWRLCLIPPVGLIAACAGFGETPVAPPRAALPIADACGGGPRIITGTAGELGPIVLAGPRCFGGAIDEVATPQTRFALTDEQGDEIFEIVHDAAPALRRQAKLLAKLRQRLNDLLYLPKSEAETAALAHALGVAAEDAARLRVDVSRKIAAVLTPTQLRRLDDTDRTLLLERFGEGCTGGLPPPV